MRWNDQNIARYIRTNDSQIKAILLHGNNEGYITKTEKDIAKSVVDLNDAFLVDELNGSNLSENDFMTALNTLSLTMQRRVVRIEGTGRALPDLIKKMVAEYSGDTLVLIRSEYLKKGIALRTLFETSPVLAAIDKYGEDSEKDIRSLVMDTVKRQGKNIDASAVNFIVRNSGNDTLILMSELEKLITYAFEKSTISLEDAMAVIEDNAVLSFDDVIYGTFNGDFERLSKSLNMHFLEENNPSSVSIMVSRMFFYHIDKMRFCQAKMAEGMDIDRAVGSLIPRMFNNVSMFKNHLMVWKKEKLDEVVKILFDLEKSAKITKMPVEIITERALFKIAAMKTNS